MQCKDAMKSRVLSCREHDSAARCAALMAEQNIGFVPVIDEQAHVVGVVTDRDLALRVLGKQRPANTPVENIMSRNVVKCSPDDSLERAEQLLAQSHKSRLVLTDQRNMLVGVLSLADVAQVEEARRAGELLKTVSRREATGIISRK